MSSIAVLTPVLGRPRHVAPLVESFRLSVEGEPHEARLLFLCSPDDNPQIRAVEAAGAEYLIVPWPRSRGDYARKINFGVRMTESEWVFNGADDLRFHPGWLSAALAAHERTGCSVIGTNDLGNRTVMRGHYATHLLVRRDYLPRAVVDSPGDMLCELYDHNCVDTELVETAKRQGAFAAALDSHVEHLHHLWGKGAVDDVYVLGSAEYANDQRLLNRRRRMWRMLKRDIRQSRLAELDRLRQTRISQMGTHQIPRSRRTR